MKKETLQKRTKIANDIMYYIYTHIETNIDIEEISIDLGVSKFHMHRIFKEAFGKNIYESIKSIRLQKASNLLYFVVKNHPFNDGNKRTGAFCFIWFLQKTNFEFKNIISPETLTTLTLLIAQSDPKEKERMR